MIRMIAMEGQKKYEGFQTKKAKSRVCVESYSIADLVNMTLIKFEQTTRLRVDPQLQRVISSK